MTTRSHGLFSLFTSAAIALAALGGCSSSVGGGPGGGAQASTAGDGGGGGGESATCPTLQPANGNRCEHEGQVCDFHDNFQECAGDFDRGTCTNGKWRVVLEGPDCSNPCWPDSCPPENTCPGAPPTEGTACGLGGMIPGPCDYTVPNPCGGTMPEEFTCSGVWVLSNGEGGGGPGCTPSQLCAAHATPADCATDSGCLWLSPGCPDGEAAPALAHAGCYPNAGPNCSVAPDTCAPDAPCTEVLIDPCWDTGCDTCGISTYVCEQP